MEKVLLIISRGRLGIDLCHCEQSEAVSISLEITSSLRSSQRQIKHPYSPLFDQAKTML